MKPMFTVHAGEFVFAEVVEKSYPMLKLWMPTKDTGVDFLITDAEGENPVSVQVKMSRDYRPPYLRSEFDERLTAAGWFVFSYSALENSLAKVWSLILVSHERRQRPIFVNLSPQALLEGLIKTHGVKKTYHVYPWVLTEGVCMQGRGLKEAHKKEFLAGSFELGHRDMTPFLENWEFLDKLVF
jgi:hypothetical protein